MAHIGKRWPILNRARFLDPQSLPSLAAPTEWRWVVYTAPSVPPPFPFEGPIGTALPRSGRGLLQANWVPGEHSVQWLSLVDTVLGRPVVLSLTARLVGTTGPLVYKCEMYYGTFLQWTCDHILQTTWLNTFPLSFCCGPFSGNQVGSDIIFYQCMALGPVTWRDTPLPPLSTPF